MNNECFKNNINNVLYSTGPFKGLKYQYCNRLKGDYLSTFSKPSKCLQYKIKFVQGCVNIRSKKVPCKVLICICFLQHCYDNCRNNELLLNALKCFFYREFQVTSLPTVNHQNVLPPYQTSSSPKHPTSSGLLHGNPADCLDYSSADNKAQVLGLNSASSGGSNQAGGHNSAGPQGSSTGSSGNGTPTPGGNGNSAAAAWKYQSFQVLQSL